MKLDITEDGLKITSENAQDDAYIRDTLGFKNGVTRSTVKKEVLNIMTAEFIYLIIPPKEEEQ